MGNVKKFLLAALAMLVLVAPTLAEVTYSGALQLGPIKNTSRKYTYQRSLPDSDWTWWWTIRIDHNSDPTTDPSTQADYLWQRDAGGGGTSGNDSYLRLGVDNNSSSTAAAKLSARVAFGGTVLHSSASRVEATTTITKHVPLTVFLMRTGSEIRLYSCARDGSVALLDTETYNASFGARNLGNCSMGASWRNPAQSDGLASYAMTESDMEAIAAGADPESVVSSGNRSALLVFDSLDATINAKWGSNHATQSGDWTGYPLMSPILPNAAARIECDEPHPGVIYGTEVGQTSASIEFTGSYAGFTPSTLQYRLRTAFTMSESVGWTDLSSFAAADGQWSGTATIPTGKHTIEIRDKTDTSKVWLGGNAWCVGPVAWTIGQSPMAIIESTPAEITSLTSDFCIALGQEGSEPYFASVAADNGFGAIATQYQVAAAGKPLALIRSAIGGTSSSQWAAESSTQMASALTKLDASLVRGHVYVMWLNGSSDLSDQSLVAGNHDTILTRLDSHMASRGLTYSYVMIPHQRQTSASSAANWSVRDLQRGWAVDHADYGSKVFLGPWLGDLRMNCEHVGIVRTVTSTTTQLAADYEGNASEPPTTIVVDGETLTVTAFNATTKVCTHAARSGSATSDVSQYAAWGSSPHQSREGAIRAGYRIGHCLAFLQAVTGSSYLGPTITAAQIPSGGDGSIIDVTVAHVSGSALRTVAGGASADNVYAFEVSTNGGSSYSAVTGNIIGANKVRLTGHGSAALSNLRVRYLYGSPVAAASFQELPNLLYDDSGVGDTDGLPVWYTATALSVTQADPEPDPDVTAPTVESATVNAAGTTLTIVLDEDCDGTDGFTVTASGGAVSLTYASGDGTFSRTYTLSRTIMQSETLTLSYAPGDVEDLFDNALEAFTDAAVTNNSMQTPPDPLAAGVLSLANKTDTTIAVTWTSATGGIGAITAQLQLDDGTGWVNVSGATESPATASGLFAVTTYDLRVVYSAGSETVYSNVLEVTTSEAEESPGGDGSFTEQDRAELLAVKQALADLSDLVAGQVKVTILPLSVSLAAGEVQESHLVAYQHAKREYTFSVTDAEGQPVGLTGKTITFAAYVPSPTPTIAFSRTTTGGEGVTIGGEFGNQITVQVTATNTEKARSLRYMLHNVTDDLPLTTGQLEIRSAPDVP